MKMSESTEVATKLIPKLVDESKIPIGNFKIDCTTNLTKNKRIDIMISNYSNKSKMFEEELITIIEVKQTNTEILNIYTDETKQELDEKLKELIEENLITYEQDSSNINYGNLKQKVWFNALIQGIWKSRKLNVNFFGVSNTLKTVFYHTETLLPINIKRKIPKVNTEHKIEYKEVVEELKGLPSYELLKDLKKRITKKNRVCDYSNLEIEEQNEKISMQEKGFVEFLGRIHNVFYKNSLKGQKKYLGDIILTFIFFKYLEERVKILENDERYESSGIRLWSNWLSKDDIDSKNEQFCGKEIYSIIETELKNLGNTEDELDSDNEFKWGYEKEYREFHSVLVGVEQIPKNKAGYEFLFKIYMELNGYNMSTKKLDKSLHLHSCNFDVYGAIYEKFKDKNEKEELGQYYTKRHIGEVLAQIVLKPYIDKIKKEIGNLREERKEKGNTITPNDIIKIVESHYSQLNIIDPSCGTGGLLTECYAYLEREYRNILGAKNEVIERLLSNDIFTGMDIEDDCVKKTKLNMFFAGDGHTDIYRGSSLDELPNQKVILNEESNKNKWNVIVSNPPYGKGREYLFVEKYIDALVCGGRIGIIIPNGILENPSRTKYRKMLISKLKIESIVSLNKFVFAPYTKQKTYMLIGYKRDKSTIKKIEGDFTEEINEVIDYDNTNIEFDNISDKIWSYILDYDGYNLSDNRWETDLIEVKDGKPKYIHNDIPELLDNYLKSEINKLNQVHIDGTLIGNKSETGDYVLSKAKYIAINEDVTADNYYNLLPEFYMRTHEPEYISKEDFEKATGDIIDSIISIAKNLEQGCGCKHERN